MEAVKEALQNHIEPALPVGRDPQSIREEILFLEIVSTEFAR